MSRALEEQVRVLEERVRSLEGAMEVFMRMNAQAQNNPIIPQQPPKQPDKTRIVSL